MSLVIPIGVANTRFVFSVEGLTEQFGFSLATTQAPTFEAINVAAALRASWSGTSIGLPAGLNDEFTFVGCVATLMTGTGPIVAQSFENVQGTNAGDSPPVNSTILCTKQTAAGGRKNRGRFNLPSGKVEEGNVDAAGFLASVVVSSISNQLDEWYDDIIVRELQPVLLHSDPADAPTVITGFGISSQMATQRRRMR